MENDYYKIEWIYTWTVRRNATGKMEIAVRYTIYISEPAQTFEGQRFCKSMLSGTLALKNGTMFPWARHIGGLVGFLFQQEAGSSENSPGSGIFAALVRP